MATFQKLQICGIRSFGCLEDLQEYQQISFDTPVTLIVGQNGCGKTTILESIKYACTSELPSNSSKGQGFVHDPKISEKIATKGQISLRLRDVQGNICTIVRCVQLQQKAQSLSFSLLDSAISIVRPNGEKQQIAGRCLDIDSQISQILQVSPSILNYVLFCHQENSSWPLDEGKRVKEIFDKIFDSQKYNKCSVLMMKLVKEKNVELKLLRSSVESQKEVKLEVARKKTNLREKKDRCNAIIEKISAKNETLNPYKIRLTEIEELERDLGNLQTQLTSKIAERKGLAQQQTMLQQKICNVFQGNEEELQIEIATFQQKQKEKERIIQALEENKREIEKKETANDKDIQKIQIKLGQLREEKKQLELRVQEQKTLFEKAKISLDLNEITWNTPEESNTATRLLQFKLKHIDEELEENIKTKRDSETTLQEKIDKVRELLAATKQKIQTNSSEIRNTNEKKLQVTNEIQDLDIANNKLVEISKQIENLTQTLMKLQSKFDESASEIKINNIKKEIETMEQSLRELEDCYKILQHNYIIEEKLNIEEQTQIKKKTEINKIKNKHSSNFKEVFDDDIPNDNISKKVQDLLIKNETEVKRINNEITIKQREITKLETQIQHKTQDLEKLEEEIQTKSTEINAVCQGNDYATLIKETYEKKEKLQRDKGSFNAAKTMYEKFIEGFEQQSACCPVCDTDFTEKKTVVKNIIEKLNKKIKTIPEKLMETEQQLRKIEQLYNKLQQLKPINDSVDVITNAKIPLLTDELETYKQNLKQLQQILDKLNIGVKKPSKIYEVCKNLITDATLLDQNKHELKTCEEKIQQLKQQRKTIETRKNKHEVESEIENLKADLSDSRKNYETQRSKLDQHKLRCQRINDEKNQLIQSQLKYQTQANKKPHLETQLEELQDNLSVLLVVEEEQRGEYKKLDDELRCLNNEKIELLNLNQRNLNMERDINNKKHKLVESIAKLNAEIKIYLEKNSTQQLEQCIETLNKLDVKRKEFADIKTKTLDKITEQKEQIAKQQTELRELHDNVTLREKQTQEALVVLQIKDLEQRIGTYNYRSVHEEKVKVKRIVETIEKEVNSLKGQEMELKNIIEDVERDLNLPHNKNAEKIYKEKFYEYKLTDLIINDLQTYQKALHRSILEFHRERMVLVNERIRELWREIYKGNDIDYIEIKADISKGHQPLKQTYDYKVVQVKNGVELEMRGRCSAGQRVLGCLIIRMALAESFSSHCGIMALDEPTTNLDRENVNSLSSALSNIVTSHVHDEHFQLLVITHDQNFLDVMRHNIQNISYYWRVSRNPQGFSIIERERL